MTTWVKSLLNSEFVTTKEAKNAVTYMFLARHWYTI